MKLVVLAGAKKNAAVPLKKDRFLIGRAQECSLRAGSDAISRRHCQIDRGDEGAMVSDLGSRNGTYVNDQKIEGPTPLKHGDRLRVGPLEFRFESEGQLSDLKQPKVVGAADVVARTADRAQGEQAVGENGAAAAGPSMEESISDWLLEEPAPAQAIRETQSFSIDETRALSQGLAEPEAPAQDETPGSDEGTRDSAGDEELTDEASRAHNGKKEPGKLPKDAFTKNAPKDSREAAMQVLRDMARRR